MDLGTVKSVFIWKNIFAPHPHLDMGLVNVVRKPAFRVSDKERHKPVRGVTDAIDCWRHEISDIKNRSI